MWDILFEPILGKPYNLVFSLVFLPVNAMGGTTMYEVYYAYGMHKGATITYTSTLEEATSFVKTKVYELSQRGIDAHCYYGIRIGVEDDE